MVTGGLIARHWSTQHSTAQHSTAQHKHGPYARFGQSVDATARIHDDEHVIDLWRKQVSVDEDAFSVHRVPAAAQTAE